MATDIYNARGGDTSGTEKLGYIRMAYGRGSVVADVDKADADGVETPAVTEISAKYDARFDDPRYYSGDTAA